MAVNISGLRRNIKNGAHNYTDAQVKVREATSNDPWGPSSTMMSEIADLTYNVVAFSEIMQMVWKRLNDNGKNWRHVYKALVLLEYLIKTGSEKVAQQCKENIFAIQTLKDFQYLDDNKDQGINVREKAKALVALLKDDERLRNERVRALKAKERFAQSTAGIGSDTVYNHTRERQEYMAAHQAAGGHPGGPGVPGGGDPHGSPSEFDVNNPEMEAARPQTAGEEELQLQLALAMSREEAEQQESKEKSDDMRLKLALQKSKEVAVEEQKKSKPSNDLLDLDFGNPAAAAAAAAASSATASESQRSAAGAVDPWGMPAAGAGAAAPAAASNDPWGSSGAGTAAAAAPAPPVNRDPWSPVKQPPAAPSPQPPAVDAFGMASSASPIPRNSAGADSDNDPWTAVKPSSSTNGAPAPPTTLATRSSGDEGNHGGGAVPDDLFSPQAQNMLKEFDLHRDAIENNEQFPGEATNGKGTTSPNPFDMSGLGAAAGVPTEATGAKPKKTVQSMLGEHSNLVNLDDLVSASATQAKNPFEHQQNPFQAKQQKPPMKDLLGRPAGAGGSGWSSGGEAGNNNNNSKSQQEELNPFF